MEVLIAKKFSEKNCVSVVKLTVYVSFLLFQYQSPYLQQIVIW